MRSLRILRNHLERRLRITYLSVLKLWFWSPKEHLTSLNLKKGRKQQSAVAPRPPSPCDVVAERLQTARTGAAPTLKGEPTCTSCRSGRRQEQDTRTIARHRTQYTQ